MHAHCRELKRAVIAAKEALKAAGIAELKRISDEQANLRRKGEQLYYSGHCGARIFNKQD